jgi:hypothetical protein
MAGGNAGFATGTAIQRNLKGILLPHPGFGEWDECAVVSLEIRPAVVNSRKAGHRSLQCGLLGKKFVDEGAYARRGSACFFESRRGWDALESGWHLGILDFGFQSSSC